MMAAKIGKGIKAGELVDLAKHVLTGHWKMIDVIEGAYHDNELHPKPAAWKLMRNLSWSPDKLISAFGEEPILGRDDTIMVRVWLLGTPCEFVDVYFKEKDVEDLAHFRARVRVNAGLSNPRPIRELVAADLLARQADPDAIKLFPGFFFDCGYGLPSLDKVTAVPGKCGGLRGPLRVQYDADRWLDFLRQSVAVAPSHMKVCREGTEIASGYIRLSLLQDAFFGTLLGACEMFSPREGLDWSVASWREWHALALRTWYESVYQGHKCGSARTVADALRDKEAWHTIIEPRQFQRLI